MKNKVKRPLMLRVRGMVISGSIVLLSGLITILMIEAGLRGWEGYVQATYPGEVASRQLYEHDAVLGWKMKPNAQVWFTNREHLIRTLVRTNRVGLRNREMVQPKRAGMVRILLIGNSSLAGFEVSAGQNVACQLEKKLNAKTATKRYEVINGGVRGYGTDQSYLYLRDYGLNLEPDLVIYIFTANDLDDNLTIHDPNRAFGKSYFVLDSTGARILKGVPVPTHFMPNDQLLTVFNNNKTGFDTSANYGGAAAPLQNRSSADQSIKESIKSVLEYSAVYRFARSALRSNKKIEQLLVERGILESWQSHVDTAWQKQSAIFYTDSAVVYKYRLVEQLVCAMRHCTDSVKIPFALFEMTNGFGPLPAQPTKIGAICRRDSIAYINAFPEFHTRSQGRLKYRFKNDGHWNAAGHKLAAEIVASFILNRQIAAELAKPVRN